MSNDKNNNKGSYENTRQLSPCYNGHPDDTDSS